MLIYEDKDDIKLVQQVASASTLISSVAGIVRDFVIERFPKGYFRHVYVDSEETASEYYTVKKYNQNVNKIPYPSMSITPEISLDDPVGGMTKSIELSSTNLFVNRDLRRSYSKLVADPNYKFNVYFSSEYITSNYNFKISLRKYIQNINAAYYIKSRFQMDFFQYLNNQSIYTELPKTFVRAIADYKRLDISNSDDMDELQDFLASASTQGSILQRKVNLSTGKECFFFDRKTNILLYFTDLDCPPSVVRNQMNDDEYTITFRVQASTWLPNAFILSVNKDIFENSLSKETISRVTNTTDDDEMSSGFYSTSISSDMVLGRMLEISYKNSSGETCIGHEVIAEVITYELEKDPTEQYFSLFGKMTIDKLKPDLKKVHSYMVSKNMVLSDVFQIRILAKNGTDNLEYSLNYEDLSITFNSSFSNELLFSLYVDRTAFDAILKAIEKDSFYFNSNALAIVKIFDDESLKVKVYSFASESEYYSTSLLKCLRVNTIYGIGYIGLVDEDDDNASNYKICIGFDSSTRAPIIKCLELAD